MGIVILGALGLYLLASIGVVLLATSYARRCGRSATRWGWGAVLVMYLIPFWDWLPTVAVHQYYCAKDSGFWVYKTLDQWKLENPGIMESLRPKSSTKNLSDGDQYILDERFAIETHRRAPVPGLSTKVTDWLLTDQKTNQVLAKEVTVGSGQGNLATGGGYKFWLSMSPCRTGGIPRLIREIEKMTAEK